MYRRWMQICYPYSKNKSRQPDNSNASKSKSSINTGEKKKRRQEDLKIECHIKIDGYTNFIFLNRFGNVYQQSSLNKALKRIIRDCNYEIFDGKINSNTILPNFSNHSLRHTFTTRMVESGTNLKVMQEILGHSDISTTMNIYAEATQELKEKEMKKLGESLQNNLPGLRQIYD